MGAWPGVGMGAWRREDMLEGRRERMMGVGRVCCEEWGYCGRAMTAMGCNNGGRELEGRGVESGLGDGGWWSGYLKENVGV